MRVTLALLALLSLLSLDAAAQDALRGKRLYLDGGRMNGSGHSCVDCHGGIPGALHGLGKAARNPAAIEYALGTVSQMAPLRGRLSTEDMADLAAYIGDPGIPSPELRLVAQDATGITAGRERLEFQAIAGKPAEAVMTLSNGGAVPLRWLSAPSITGPHSSPFLISATDCKDGMTLAPQQSCRIQVSYRADPAGMLRTAVLGLRHDWLGGGVYVALIGRLSRPSTDAPRARSIQSKQSSRLRE